MVSLGLLCPRKVTLGIQLALGIVLIACCPKVQRAGMTHLPPATVRPGMPPLAEEIELPPNVPGMEPGMGYNTLTGRPSNTRCVVVKQLSDGQPDFGLWQNKGQATTYEILKVSSSETAHRHFSGSASASFGVGIFSATIKTVSDATTANFNQSYVARVRVENQARSLPTPHPLTAEARAALARSTAEFLSLCGNRFISGEVTGGLLDGELTTTSLNASELSETSGELGAKIGLFGSAADFKIVKEAVEKRTESRFHLVKYGGVGAQDSDDLVAAANSFPTQVEQNSGAAWRMRTHLSSYSGLAGNRKELDLTSEEEYLMELAATFDKALALRAELWYVAAHPAEFDPPNDPAQFKALAAQVDQVVVQLQTAAQACMRDAGAAAACKSVTSSTLPLNPVGPPKAEAGQTYLDYRNPALNQGFRMTAAFVTSGVEMEHSPLHDGLANRSGYMDYYTTDGSKYRAEIIANPGGAGFGFRHTSFAQKPLWFGLTIPADTHFDTIIAYLDPDNHPMCATVLVGRKNRIRFAINPLAGACVRPT
jgi:hypothetical protein